MRHIVFAIFVLTLALGAGRLAATTGRADARAEPPVAVRVVGQAQAQTPPRQITVRFKPGVSDAAVRRLNATLGTRLIKGRGLSGVQRLEVPDVVSLDSVIAAYRNSPYVAEAGVTRVARILQTPNDPSFPYQWHLRSTDAGIWADTAWDLATNRGAGVLVAVIDTGVAYEDYNGSLGGRPQSFKQAPDLAATTFVAPWDFANNDAHPDDDHGHGTHVTGTIAENTGNAYAMAGVAYNASIMPLKAMDYAGNGNDADVVDAIFYAVNNGAKIINMSLGWPGSGAPDTNGNVCTEIVGLNAALDYAYSHGVTVVAASGNDGGDTVLCPAAYPTVIAVGATRFDGQVTSYSDQGSALDIAAPGGDPYVDQNGDGYPDGVLQQTLCYDPTIMLLLNWYGSFCNVYNAGTSMATPHVAGTAALLLGENPILTPDEVRGYLQSTARDRGAPGWDSASGWGALDAAGAVAALLGVPKPPPPVVQGLDAPTNLTATTVSSNRIDLAWTDNATNEAGFKIERSSDGVSFAEVGLVSANTTSYAASNLSAATAYTFRVRAYNGPDYSGYSNTASATTLPPPAAPSNLTATAVSSSRISLTWTDNATNEAGFKLERSTDGLNFTQLANLGANVTTYSNINLSAGTTYTYRIRAYEGPNNSDYSNTASATTQPAPAAPSNLIATAVSSSRINLTWKDNATNEAGFRIERSTDGVNFTQIGLVSANATSYAATNLSAATAYTFRVRAYDGPNNSGYSNTASATTQPPPAAPSNLTAIAVSSSRINLTWKDNATNEAGFKIERSTDGVNFTQVGLVSANWTSYAATNLSAATAYTFRVRAYDGPNHSGYSNSASATTLAKPAAPSNLAAIAVSSSRINLAWTDNATNEAGFRIERSTDGVHFTQVGLVAANTTSYAATKLSGATTYTFRVRAYNGSDYSAYSNTASATTLN